MQRTNEWRKRQIRELKAGSWGEGWSKQLWLVLSYTVEPEGQSPRFVAVLQVLT